MSHQATMPTYNSLKNDEKLQYLHKITKNKFLVSNTNMGLCLYIQTHLILKDPIQPFVPGFMSQLLPDPGFSLANAIS